MYILLNTTTTTTKYNRRIFQLKKSTLKVFEYHDFRASVLQYKIPKKDFFPSRV